jgi:hypothetical protein
MQTSHTSIISVLLASFALGALISALMFTATRTKKDKAYKSPKQDAGSGSTDDSYLFETYLQSELDVDKNTYFLPFFNIRFTLEQPLSTVKESKLLSIICPDGREHTYDDDTSGKRLVYLKSGLIASRLKSAIKTACVESKEAEETEIIAEFTEDPGLLKCMLDSTTYSFSLANLHEVFLQQKGLTTKITTNSEILFTKEELVDDESKNKVCEKNVNLVHSLLAQNDNIKNI